MKNSVKSALFSCQLLQGLDFSSSRQLTLYVYCKINMYVINNVSFLHFFFNNINIFYLHQCHCSVVLFSDVINQTADKKMTIFQFDQNYPNL